MIDVAAIHRAAPAPLALCQRLGLEIGRGSRPERARVRCPAHAERNASCDVTTRDGRIVWICRSCGEGGDLLALVAAVRGLDTRGAFREVAAAAAEVVGVRVEDDGPVTYTRRDPVVDLAATIDRAAEQWLGGRPVWAPQIEQASAEQIGQAFAVLREADRDRPPPETEDEYRERRLEELADRYERWQRRPEWHGGYMGPDVPPDDPRWDAWRSYRAALGEWERS